MFFISLSPFQRVMMQIVQELCKRPGLNKCGFDMPTIYIPNPNKVGPALGWSCHETVSFLISIQQTLAVEKVHLAKMFKLNVERCFCF